MVVLSATLNQIAFLFLFIIIGYIIARFGFISNNAQGVLSKLENLIFIPALVLGTFINNFTAQKISQAWKLLLASLILEIIAIGVSLVCVRFCSKDKYEQNIFTYGLCFSNFGFMGNAVVSALFPEIFLEYLIFTLPLWSLIYIWGVPVLLLSNGSEKPTFKQRMKNFVNPMFVCTLLGMLIGLINIPIPQFVLVAVNSAGNCMSPIAMLITGMTIAQFNVKEVLKIKSVYLVTFLRLLVFPVIFLVVLYFVPFSKTFATCAICSLAMPLGLNTIIIPSALGKDTKVASGMALVSHLLCAITIPVIFIIFQTLC